MNCILKRAQRHLDICTMPAATIERTLMRAACGSIYDHTCFRRSRWHLAFPPDGVGFSSSKDLTTNHVGHETRFAL